MLKLKFFKSNLLDMRNGKLLFILFFAFVSFLPAFGDEGMWIPMLIEKLNIQEMQEKGFNLTAEDIYSVNKASMKDAVMIFGGGCTAELISSEGLLITNHHCGYRSIQKHSTVEHDYLTNGFWAMSPKEELPNPGLKVTFLKWMEDVTLKSLEGVNNGMSGKERKDKISENNRKIVAAAIKNKHFSAHVEPFFAGNQYFLFVEEIFRDIRFVGAPPSSIGKFGGDTDNWMWPRHTGDFSLFRIYASKDNKPAKFSQDNVPYKPAKFFSISLKGVHPDDFTLVLGYPGSTYEYVPSYHIKMLTQEVYPKLIDIRDKKLEVMNADMLSDPGVRIQYSAKYASVSNSWKRWIGEINGLDKLDALAKKQAFEKGFQKWIESDPARKEKYGTLFLRYRKVYKDFGKYRLARDYINEIFIRNGAELVSFSAKFANLIELVENGANSEVISGIAGQLKNSTKGFFKDYNQATDKKLFIALMKKCGENMSSEFQPSVFINIHSKYKDDYVKYMESVYKKTNFTNEDYLLEILNNPTKARLKKLKNDPIFKIFESADDMMNGKINPEYSRLSMELKTLDREYMAAQMEYQKNKIFYSDANFTLRLSYGNVKGYNPRDAVFFKHYTTIKGIIEKDNPQIYDYDVPDKLKELYKSGDFGRYAENGELHVCFIATNHTTGGNSGSPVLNADGQLVGINFDRAWEGVMSDLMFNPDQCRNISLDIRYVLFLIDKFAGAGYLLDEMDLVE